MKTRILFGLFFLLPLSAMSQTETASTNLAAAETEAGLLSSELTHFNLSEATGEAGEVIFLDAQGVARLLSDPNLNSGEEHRLLQSSYNNASDADRVSICASVSGDLSAGICSGKAGVRFRRTFGGNR